jgi:pyruvate,water dikinase
MVVKTKEKQLVWFEEVGKDDVAEVGGKNANLGEMIRELKNKGIPVPDGFATTAGAYRAFLEANNLTEKIQDQLEQFRSKKKSLQEVGSTIRQLFDDAEFPSDLADSIKASYRELGKRYKTDNVSVAVRSSGTAEDLPEASFAGQQESFLNVTGEKALLEACKKCYASLFTDRSINYREDRGFAHMKIALSIGIQKMVRSDEAAAGVIFSLDPDTGFRNVVVVTGAWGLGESVVQGQVTPDEFMVFKPLLNNDKLLPIISRTVGAKERKIIYSSGRATTKNVATTKQEQGSFCLSDEEVMGLARWAVIIEDHY